MFNNISSKLFVALTMIVIGASSAVAQTAVVETPVWGQSNAYSNASPGVGTGAYSGGSYAGEWDGTNLVNPALSNMGGSFYNSVTTTGGGDTGNPISVTGGNPSGNAYGQSNAFIGVGEEGTLPLYFLEGKSTVSGEVVAPEGYDPLTNFSAAGSQYTGSFNENGVNINVSGGTNTAVVGGGSSTSYSNTTNYFQSAPMGTPNPVTP